MTEPLYKYVKGSGWVLSASRTPQDIVNAWTWDKASERSGRLCRVCTMPYFNHSGDSCDFPYAGREWTD